METLIHAAIAVLIFLCGIWIFRVKSGIKKNMRTMMFAGVEFFILGTGSYWLMNQNLDEIQDLIERLGPVIILGIVLVLFSIYIFSAVYQKPARVMIVSSFIWGIIISESIWGSVPIAITLMILFSLGYVVERIATTTRREPAQ